MSSVDDLVDELSDRIDKLACSITSQIRAEVPGYERVAEAEHLDDIRAQIVTVLKGLRTRCPPPAAAFDQCREVGRRRAASLLALQDLVEAYHIAYREIWNALLVGAQDRPELIPELAGDVALVWSWFHRLTGAATDAHATETRARAATRATMRRRFVDALNGQHADGEALAPKLGFVPGRDFHAACTGPMDEEAVERIDANFVTAEQPAMAVPVRGHGLLVGQTPVDLTAAIRTHDPRVRIGLGLSRGGISGAAASVRDANEAVELALTVNRDIDFGTDWHAVVLHAARARLEPLMSRGRDIANSNPALADAVQAYAESGFTVTACARLLGVHTNTAKYRLQRWQALTGWDVHRLEDLTASMACLDTSDRGCRGQGRPDATRSET